MLGCAPEGQWSPQEGLALLWAAFAAQARQEDPEGYWLARLCPEATAYELQRLMQTGRTEYATDNGPALVRWVVESHMPHWPRKYRRRALRVLTDWAVACGAPRSQVQLLLKLEQLQRSKATQRVRSVRRGDRPPR
ncbi:hypothetical protein HRbin18_00525 [bacterium HR18]|uniref:Uncharacterized protein n=1 Tax=Rhodothermus marinus TaxID=29549 RepID=A0A7V2AYY3_RHOMR|nr:hypothetical protein HRbin18_00525 [bacterium HR18]